MIEVKLVCTDISKIHAKRITDQIDDCLGMEKNNFFRFVKDGKVSIEATKFKHFVLLVEEICKDFEASVIFETHFKNGLYRRIIIDHDFKHDKEYYK